MLLTTTFGNGEQLASISSDGILRFNVEANDENATQFIKCIESILNARKLTAIEVTIKEPLRAKTNNLVLPH